MNPFPLFDRPLLRTDHRIYQIGGDHGNNLGITDTNLEKWGEILIHRYSFIYRYISIYLYLYQRIYIYTYYFVYEPCNIHLLIQPQ
jgi:hypothetical protein